MTAMKGQSPHSAPSGLAGQSLQSAFGRAASPVGYGTAGVVVATFGGLALPGRPAGLGLSLVLLGVVLAGAWATRRMPVWWALAGVQAVMPFLRTAGWVVALSVLGSLGTAVAAASRATTWGRLATAPGRFLLALVPGPTIVVTATASGTSGAVVRGLAGGTLLVALFGSLLVAADAAFADLADALAPTLDPWHLAVGVLVAAVMGALLLVATLPAPEAQPAPAPVVGRTETRIALGALVGLFAVFVAVQAATLFGGDAFVRRSAGLTYAQYARSGFWLLLVVAGLTLAVIATAVRLARPDRWLLGALGILTVVILASAWHRLGLYVDAYGATRAREFAAWSIAWLVGLFALLLTRRCDPRTVVTWSAVLGVAFGLSNPDARIAHGTKDGAYRASLSDDARPACAGDRAGGLLSATLRDLGC